MLATLNNFADAANQSSINVVMADDSIIDFRILQTVKEADGLFIVFNTCPTPFNNESGPTSLLTYRSTSSLDKRVEKNVRNTDEGEG
ncbi:hypothetical protein ACFLT8_03205 [Chloroflexota bacterium]